MQKTKGRATLTKLNEIKKKKSWFKINTLDRNGHEFDILIGIVFIQYTLIGKFHLGSRLDLICFRVL